MRVKRAGIIGRESSHRGAGLRILVSAVILVVTTGGLVWLLFFSPVFEVREVNYHGKVRVPEERLNAAEKQILGRSMFLAPFDSLRNLIESYPEVKKVVFRRKLFHTIDCYLIERKPVALILNPTVFGVSEDCVLLRRDLDPDCMDLPMITGLSTKDLMTQKGMERLKKAITVLNLFKESGFEGEIEVSEIYVRGEDISMVVGCLKPASFKSSGSLKI